MKAGGQQASVSKTMLVQLLSVVSIPSLGDMAASACHSLYCQTTGLDIAEFAVERKPIWVGF